MSPTTAAPRQATVPEALALAWRAFECGRLEVAERACQAVLGALPDELEGSEAVGWRTRAGNLLWRVRQAREPDPRFASESGQDAYVWRTFFPEAAGGVFVDVGAFDGATGSNTWFFEKHLGWTGLCLEPSPAQFARLAAVRGARCLRLCAADEDGTAPFVHVREGCTMMSGLRADRAPDADLLAAAHPAHAAETIDVPVRRLSAILDEAGITEVDYCSIDVEGSELRVLRGIDFARHPIRVLSVENNRGDPSVRRHLFAAGYRLSAILGADEIYARAG